MIRKTRLFTPGPTPLLPAAQFAMAAADIHHRTAGIPRAVPEGSPRPEDLCRDQERCHSACLLRNRRDGSIGIEPDLARRPRPGAYRGQVRRALGKPGQGIWLRCRCGQRALWPDLRSRRSAQGAQDRDPRPLHAGDRDLDRGSPPRPRRRGAVEAERHGTRCWSSTRSPAWAPRTSIWMPGASTC